MTAEQSLLSWHLQIPQLAKQSFLICGNTRHKSGVTAEQSILSLQIAEVVVSKLKKRISWEFNKELQVLRSILIEYWIHK